MKTRKIYIYVKISVKLSDNEVFFCNFNINALN